MSGTLPITFGQLSKLEHLSLSNNQLNGPLPDLTGLSSLRLLRISNNKLSGPVPESIAQRSRREAIDLSSNSFDGIILKGHFSNFSRLKSLDISQNALSFNLSSDWFPPFQLDAFSMKSCKVGPAFPNLLRTQRKLNLLDLSNASTSYSIPSWFSDLPSTLVDLKLLFNKIHGKLPYLSSKRGSEISFDFSWNYLEGPLLSFPPVTVTLHLSNKMFSGSVSSLCESPSSSLLELDFSNNRFSGELPTCWTQFQGLRFLNLAGNYFTGNVPTSLGYLPQLKRQILRKNKLTGEKPSLQNCKCT